MSTWEDCIRKRPFGAYFHHNIPYMIRCLRGKDISDGEILRRIVEENDYGLLVAVLELIRNEGIQIKSWVTLLKDLISGMRIEKKILQELVSHVPFQDAIRENIVSVASEVRQLNWNTILLLTIFTDDDTVNAWQLVKIDPDGFRQFIDRAVDADRLVDHLWKVGDIEQRNSLVSMVLHHTRREFLINNDELFTRVLDALQDHPEVYARETAFVDLLQRLRSHNNLAVNAMIDKVVSIVGIEEVTTWLKKNAHLLEEDVIVRQKSIAAIVERDAYLRDHVLRPTLSLYDYHKVYTVLNIIYKEDLATFVNEYMRHYDAMSFIEMYLTDDDPERQPYFEKLAKECVLQGYALSSKRTSQFSLYITDFRKRWIKETQTKYSVKAIDFLNFLLDYYKDIPDIVQHSENLSPEGLDALHMYAHSSSIFNEPFKKVSFVQRTLKTSRRRPTAVQTMFINQFDSMFKDAKTLTRGIYAWRGVALPDFNSVDNSLDVYKSLSLSIDISKEYLRGKTCCLMRVYVPAGTPLLAVDPVQQYKQQGGLYEFVLPRYAIFKHVGTSVDARTPTMTIFDMKVELPTDLKNNLYMGMLRPKRKIEDVYSQDTQNIERLHTWRNTMMNELFRYLSNTPSILERISDSSFPIQERWAPVEEALLRRIKLWRARQLTVNVHVDDDFLRQQLTGLRLHLAPMLLAYVAEENEMDLSTMLQEFMPYIQHLSEIDAPHAIKRFKLL